MAWASQTSKPIANDTFPPRRPPNLQEDHSSYSFLYSFTNWGHSIQIYETVEANLIWAITQTLKQQEQTKDFFFVFHNVCHLYLWVKWHTGDTILLTIHWPAYLAFGLRMIQRQIMLIIVQTWDLPLWLNFLSS